MDGGLYTLVTIVMLIGFLILAYQFYVGVEKSNILYLGPGKQGLTLSGKNVQPSVYADEYTFSAFIYADSDTYSDGDDIEVFSKGKISVTLNGQENRMTIHSNKKIEIEMIPIGRWFHFALVLRDQASDIYIDGKLKNHMYSNDKSDLDPEKSIVINKDQKVNLAKFVYYSRALSSSEIIDIKDSGPGAGIVDALTQMLKSVLVEADDSEDIESITRQKCARLSK